MMQETVLLSIPLTQLQTLIIDSVNACLDVRTEAPKPASGFITRQEAADILHITLPTLLSRTLEGKIKGYRNGRRVLYKKSEVENAVTEISTSQKKEDVR